MRSRSVAWQMTTLVEKLAVASISAGVIVSSLLAKPAEVPSPAIPYKEVVKDELDLWIDKLVEYESCPVEGMIDRNRKMSYGCLCFQETTFEVYTRLYNLLPEAEDQELINMIGDCEFQKMLVRKMIEDNYNNWTHWYASVVKRGLGKPPKINE